MGGSEPFWKIPIYCFVNQALVEHNFTKPQSCPNYVFNYVYDFCVSLVNSGSKCDKVKQDGAEKCQVDLSMLA